MAVMATNTTTKLVSLLKKSGTNEAKPDVQATSRKASILLDSYVKERAEADSLSSNKFAIFTSMTIGCSAHRLGEDTRSCFRILQVVF